MITEIKNWIDDRQRTYAVGLALFEKFAHADMRRKYLEYFRCNADSPMFSVAFGMLAKKLSFINANYSVDSISIQVEKTSPSASDEVRETPGSRLANIPESLAPVAERIKEIVKIKAHLATLIADEHLPRNEAKAFSEQIVALETERKALWQKIDNYKQEEEPKPQTTYADGARLAKDIKNIKEKIKRNTIRAKKADGENKEKILEKIEALKIELEEKQKQLEQ